MRVILDLPGGRPGRLAKNEWEPDTEQPIYQLATDCAVNTEAMRSIQPLQQTGRA